MTEILFFLLLGGIGVYGWKNTGIKRHALKMARAECAKHELQLLDESMVLRKIWLQRDAQGDLKIRRRYVFEFSSTGDRRYHGAIVLLGWRVIGVEFDAHRIAQSP